MSTFKRWRGLRALVTDAVEHGSRAIERVQMDTAKRTFDVLEAIPPIAAPVKLVHLVHDATVGGVYGTIRVVNQVVGASVEAAFEAVDEGEAKRRAKKEKSEGEIS
jgi:hypothetical protein